MTIRGGKILVAAFAFIAGFTTAANASCFKSDDKALMTDISKNDIANGYVEKYRTLIRRTTFRACLKDETSTEQSKDELVLKALPKGDGLTIIVNVAHGTGHAAWRVLLSYESVRADARIGLTGSCVTSQAYELARILMRLPEIAAAAEKVEDNEPFSGEIFCKNMRAIYEPKDYDAIVVELPQYAPVLNAARARNQDFIAVISALGQLTRDKLRQPVQQHSAATVAQKH